MISAPSVEDHPTILADWLELQAFSAPSGQAEILSLRDETDLTQDSEAEDIADFDAKADAIVGRVTTELHDRIKILGGAYPFRVNNAGTLLILRDVLDTGIGPAAYLACLLMSHVSSSPILDGMDVATEAKAGRDIFQICATVSAAGWCGGPAISFGWPRRDRSGFSQKLAETYAIFGDGTPRAEPLAGAPEHIKDGGIDVIAWRRMEDGLPGTMYLLGQSASGENWKGKSVLNDIPVFHWAWFEVQPASQPIGAMFVPFCITDVEETPGEFASQGVLISRMQFIAKEFGQFFYRYRLPVYAARVSDLVAGGTGPIEGYAELAQIWTWVKTFRDRLAGAPA